MECASLLAPMRRWFLVLQCLLALAGCARGPMPASMHVIAFWPEPNTATLWLSVRDGNGEALAVDGQATATLWETGSAGESADKVGDPLHTWTMAISSAGSSPADESCRPCSLAGARGAASLGSIAFAWLPKPSHKMGLLEVTLELETGAVLTDVLRFSFPE